MKRAWSFFLLFCVAFVLMAGGGCGGGGSGGGGSSPFDPGGGSGYPPSYPTSPVPPTNPTDPTTPTPGEGDVFTEEDVKESQQVLSDAAKVFDGETTATVGDFFDRYAAALRNDSRVESVTAEKKESVYEAYIEVNFKNGFRCRVMFTSKEREDIYNVSSSTSGVRSAAENWRVANNSVHAAKRASDIKAYIGAGLYKSDDNTWWFWDKGAADEVHAKMRAFGAASEIKRQMPWRDLRSLQGYDYIFINAHGQTDAFALGVEDQSAVYNDADVVKDITMGRLSPLIALPFVEIAGENVQENQWLDIAYVFPLLGPLLEADETYSAVLVHPKFFTDYYATHKLSNPIILLQSCEVLKGTAMSGALLAAGAKCVIGYDESVSFTWGNETCEKITDALLAGHSVAGALGIARNPQESDPYAGWGKPRARLVTNPTNVENIFLVDEGSNPTTNGNHIDTADVNWYRSAPTAPGYTLTTSQQLAGLAQLVNTGLPASAGSGSVRAAATGPIDFAGKTITLAGDIDLSGKEWTPIGGAGYATGGERISNAFMGDFDGGGYTISGMTITGDYGSTGLFGGVSSVKNLNMKGVNINIGSVEYGRVGSIAGSAFIISNCTSSGSISVGYPSEDMRVGGIVGESSDVMFAPNRAPGSLGVSGVLNCTFNGNIYAPSNDPYPNFYYSSKSYAGGIVGFLEDANNSLRVSGCTFSGSVSGATYSGGIAGIAGFGGSDCTVGGATLSDSCISRGNVSSIYCAGGIVGYIRANTETLIQNNQKPEGSVSTENGAFYEGGVIGLIDNLGSLNLSYNYVISGNTFSKSATGQEYGIGREPTGSTGGAPSNAGCIPQP